MIEEPNLIQEKIKKMIQSKKKLNKKEQFPHQIFKSNQGNEEIQSNIENQNNKKTKINIKKRASSVRHIDSANLIGSNNNLQGTVLQGSMNEHMEGNNIEHKNIEIDLKEIFSNVFENGHKFKQFVKKEDISFEYAKNLILNSEIVMLSIQAKLTQIVPEKHNEKAEEELIRKIGKILQKQKQETTCKSSEERITSLIDKRLKELKKY